MSGWDWALLAVEWALLMAAVLFPGTATGLAAACILWTVDLWHPWPSLVTLIITVCVSFTWHKCVHHRFGRMRVLAWLYHHPPIPAIAAAAVAIVTGPDWVSLTGYVALVAVALWLALRRTTRPAVEILQPQALEPVRPPQIVFERRTVETVETAVLEQPSFSDRLPYIE